MKLSFNGLNQIVASFNGSVSVGDIITLNNNGIVKKAVADKDIHGVCVSNNGTVVGVQLKGSVTLPYTGTAPTVGYCVLQTAGNNAVKAASNGQAYLVLSVNTDSQTTTILL